MKKRENGFTLIEIIVAIAILLIMMSMLSPIIQTTVRSNEKEKIINDIDTRLGKTVELIKRTARSAKTKPASSNKGVTLAAIVVSPDHNTVTMNVPIENGDNITDAAVTFRYTSPSGIITAQSGTAGAIDVIASNVSRARFEYTQNVLTIQIKVDLNNKNLPENKKEEWKAKEIRDAAVTRLDVE